MTRHKQAHIENGFVVDYKSDVDDVRYIIIDPDDADMTGWKLEVGLDESWYMRPGREGPANHTPCIDEFTRDLVWFTGEGGGWSGLGYGEASYPWSAPVDHNERILRWIAPDPV